MMPSARWALLALLALGAMACQAEHSASYVTATFALNAPAGDGGATSLRDESGIFDLQAFPAFVALSITAPDMDRASVVWPASPADYMPGEQTVELALDVPAGDGRTVELTVFLFQQDRAFCFVEAEATTVDLAPGDEQVVTLDAIASGMAWLKGVADESVEEVWLIDTLTAVRLDRTFATAGQFTFDFVCSGRKLALAWVGSDEVVHYDPLASFTLLPGENRTDITLP